MNQYMVKLIIASPVYPWVKFPDAWICHVICNLFSLNSMEAHDHHASQEGHNCVLDTNLFRTKCATQPQNSSEWPFRDA